MKNRASQIVKENNLLLRKMKEISQNGSGIKTGVFESKPEFPMFKEKSLTKSQRKLRLYEITAQNKKLHKVIQHSKSDYSLKNFQKNWKSKHTHTKSPKGEFVRKFYYNDLSATRFAEPEGKEEVGEELAVDQMDIDIT